MYTYLLHIVEKYNKEKYDTYHELTMTLRQ